MQMRTFGRSGMQISLLGFGCGAVGGLMVRGAPADQERTIARALEAGVNYFDTAVQYGDGESEKNLGRTLQKLKPTNAIVGTKVRLPSADLGRIGDAVAKSLDGSLNRLCLERVDILHLHNAITVMGGGEALSVTQVLDEVAPAFERLRAQGKTRLLGITAVGDTAALHQVIDARLFDSAQVVYNMLNPIRRHIASGKLSGAGLRSAIRPYPGGRRRRGGHPRTCRRRALRFGRTPPDSKPTASTDRLCHQLRHGSRTRATAAAACERGVCREPDRSGHTFCHVPPCDGHHPCRDGDPSAVRAGTSRGAKGSATTVRP